MRRIKLFAVFAAVLPLMLAASCDDYRGLNEITIIAGIAVDASEDNPGEYTLMYEIVEAKSSGDGEKGTANRVYSSGRNLNEAIHNLSGKLKTNLSYSHVEVLVISRKLAEEQGLHDMLDPFLRDAGIRENMTIIISAAETAAEILTPPDDPKKIVSFELNSSLNNDSDSIDADGARTLGLYQIYNILETGSADLMLPSICYDEADEATLRLDGLAVFRGDKMVELVPYPAAKYVLIAESKLTDGSYTLSNGENGEDFYLSIAIRKSLPGKSFEFDGERLRLGVNMEVTASAVDFSSNWPELDFDLVEKIEKWAEDTLCRNIKLVLDELTGRTGADVLGFAGSIRRGDTALWRRLEPEWERYFKEAELEVTCDIYIEDSGLIMDYKT